MKLHQVFKEARGLLWDGTFPRGPHDQRFICNAIRSIRPIGELSDEEFFEIKRQAREVIRSRMGKEIALEDWLMVNGHATRKQITNEKIQAYRQNWLLSLEKEFKELGQ